jgi:probable F420-dependent oxidoreductase
VTLTGLLLPYRGWPATDAVQLACIAEDLGYDSVWASEVAGADGFALLAAVASRTTAIRLGTAIVPLGTRSPALLAMSAQTVSSLSDGRFSLGVGVSSRQIVESWHGVEQGSPLVAVRDALTIIDQVLTGRVTDHVGHTFPSSGFRLAVPDVPRPDILVAALGPRMRRLAMEIADGVILNFLPRSTAAELLESFRAMGRPFRVLALVRVAVTSDGDHAERPLRRELASYMRIGPYARWLESRGFSAEVEAASSAVSLDDQANALSDAFVRDVSVMGDATACRAQLRQLTDLGIETIVVPTTADQSLDEVVRVVHAVAA